MLFCEMQYEKVIVRILLFYLIQKNHTSKPRERCNLLERPAPQVSGNLIESSVRQGPVRQASQSGLDQSSNLTVGSKSIQACEVVDSTIITHN
jgi:hypothetical protein